MQHLQPIFKEPHGINLNSNIGRAFGRELTNYGSKQDMNIELQKGYVIIFLSMIKIYDFKGLRTAIIPPQKSHLQPANIKNTIQIQKENVNETIILENCQSKEAEDQQNIEIEYKNESNKAHIIDEDDDDDYESLDPVDKENYGNIQYVIPYVKSIFKHLRMTEVKSFY